MWIPEGQSFLARLCLILEATAHRSAMMSGLLLFIYLFSNKREVVHDGGFIGETTGPASVGGVWQGEKKKRVLLKMKRMD